jgi:hypothetical protein
MGIRRADERTRTADLLITSELLYQLSYVGLFRAQSIPQRPRAFTRFRLTQESAKHSMLPPFLGMWALLEEECV